MSRKKQSKARQSKASKNQSESAGAGKKKWYLIGIGALVLSLAILFLVWFFFFRNRGIPFTEALGLSGRNAYRPNVIMVMIDTLNVDHCSLFGYSRETTPYLKQMASEGIFFSNVVASSPWTKPSVTTILT